VWLAPSGDVKHLEFQAISDSAIVSGLIALLLRVYSGRSAEEILATEPRFIDAIGLAKHLSPTRSNGLAAMLATIKQHARAALGRGG
jgi:cysteine desulfuration protein SufE